MAFPVKCRPSLFRHTRSLYLVQWRACILQAPIGIMSEKDGLWSIPESRTWSVVEDFRRDSPIRKDGAQIHTLIALIFCMCTPIKDVLSSRCCGFNGRSRMTRFVRPLSSSSTNYIDRIIRMMRIACGSYRLSPGQINLTAIGLHVTSRGERQLMLERYHVIYVLYRKSSSKCTPSLYYPTSTDSDVRGHGPGT
jgi:hypothetical protein